MIGASGSTDRLELGRNALVVPLAQTLIYVENTKKGVMYVYHIILRFSS